MTHHVCLYSKPFCVKTSLNLSPIERQKAHAYLCPSPPSLPSWLLCTLSLLLPPAPTALPSPSWPPSPPTADETGLNFLKLLATCSFLAKQPREKVMYNLKKGVHSIRRQLKLLKAPGLYFSLSTVKATIAAKECHWTKEQKFFWGGEGGT